MFVHFAALAISGRHSSRRRSRSRRTCRTRSSRRSRSRLVEAAKEHADIPRSPAEPFQPLLDVRRRCGGRRRQARPGGDGCGGRRLADPARPVRPARVPRPRAGGARLADKPKPRGHRSAARTSLPFMSEASVQGQEVIDPWLTWSVPESGPGYWLLPEGSTYPDLAQQAIPEVAGYPDLSQPVQPGPPETDVVARVLAEAEASEHAVPAGRPTAISTPTGHGVRRQPTDLHATLVGWARSPGIQSDHHHARAAAAGVGLLVGVFGRLGWRRRAVCLRRVRCVHVVSLLWNTGGIGGYGEVDPAAAQGYHQSRAVHAAPG